MELAEMYEKYGAMVLRRCRQLLANEEEALDVMQDTFVQLCQARQPLRVEHPSSFLFVSATNLCLNRIRDRRRQGVVNNDQLLDTIATLDDTERRVTAWSSLRKLFGRQPKSSRTIAVLHFVDGMTLEETAREVGMSVSGVRKRLRTLRSTLARIENV